MYIRIRFTVSTIIGVRRKSTLYANVYRVEIPIL